MYKLFCSSPETAPSYPVKDPKDYQTPCNELLLEVLICTSPVIIYGGMKFFKYLSEKLATENPAPHRYAYRCGNY